MTIGISIALMLGAGLHTARGTPVLKRRFEAAWGTTEVFVANATGWELACQRAWQHRQSWSIHFAQNFQLVYAIRLEAKSLVPYGDMRQHRTSQRFGYGELHRHRSRQRFAYGDMHQSKLLQASPYGELAACRLSMRFAYWLTQSVAARHVLNYSVTNVNPMAKRFSASWSLLDDARLQAVMNSPEMTSLGQVIQIVQASLSCDEDSPLWLAQVEVARLADFASIAIGQTITLTLGEEAFVLVVDGKTLSRESPTDQRFELSAVSPVAMLDAPFAATIRLYQPNAEWAQAAVESLIGPVSWQVPNWRIPAGRLMLEGVTPLAAARNITSSIGAILESNPDGSVVCRMRHPVSIPQYGQAEVAHDLFDSDVISANAQIAPSRGFNRVTIANEDGAASDAADRIEYVADDGDAYQGTVRSYLSGQRAVVLGHTGHPATVIASLGEVMRIEVETVEFVAGQGSTRYPVTAIASAIWQHADLGALVVDSQSPNTLASASPGNSLLRLSYTVTSLNWRVALGLDEEVQFVLIES